jgi:glucokinase
MGAAKGRSHALGVFFGTGVGGAAIINGKLYKGASGMGGQVGGLLAQPVGGPEAAQSHGIIDRIAGKSAIAAEAAQMAAKNWAPYLHTHGATDLSAIGWRLLAKAVQAGDDRVKEMIGARMFVVGIALSNVVNFLNPEMLVLGGGLLDALPGLVTRELERGLQTHLVAEVREALEIRKAKLGGQSVAIGAAILALDHLP